MEKMDKELWKYKKFGEEMDKEMWKYKKFVGKVSPNDYLLT